MKSHEKIQKEAEPLLNQIWSQTNGEAKLVHFMVSSILEKPTPKSLVMLFDFLSKQEPKYAKTLNFSKINNFFKTSIKKNTVSIKTWLEWIDKYPFIKPGSSNIGALTKFLSEQKPTGYQDMLDTLSTKTSSIKSLQIMGEFIECIQKSTPISKNILAEMSQPLEVDKTLSAKEKQEKRSTKNLLVLNMALKPHPEMGQMLEYFKLKPTDIFMAVATQKKERIQQSLKSLVSLIDWSPYIAGKTQLRDNNFFMSFLGMIKAAAKDQDNHNGLYHRLIYSRYTEKIDTMMKDSGQRAFAQLLICVQQSCDMTLAEMKETLSFFTPFLKHNFSKKDPKNVNEEYSAFELFFEEVYPELNKLQKTPYIDNLLKEIQSVLSSYEKMKLQKELNAPTNEVPKIKFKI